METTRNSYFGGPLIFAAKDHTEFVNAFYRISEDREKQIVILTGAGGEFIPRIDLSSFGNFAPHIEQAAPGDGFG
jgi:enoyl-CoA hydratase/carnithine racemase